VDRVALGNPRTVPAGRYAEACLRGQGLWEGLRDRLVFGENVRQVLDYVAREEVEAGFVYATDIAMRARAVRVALLPPGDGYPPIRYPAAVTAASRRPALGRAFLDLLAGPDGQAAFLRRGFRPAAGAP
jgi:molybdate transport system substrate-binding protein